MLVCIHVEILISIIEILILSVIVRIETLVINTNSVTPKPTELCPYESQFPCVDTMIGALGHEISR